MKILASDDDDDSKSIIHEGNLWWSKNSIYILLSIDFRSMWKLHQTTSYPVLRKIARRFLAIVGSSVLKSELMLMN